MEIEEYDEKTIERIKTFERMFGGVSDGRRYRNT